MSDDNPSIISHISVGTNDFARATAFYEVVLAHAKQLPTEVMTLFLQDAAVALKVIAPDGSTYPLKSSVPAENRSDLSEIRPRNRHHAKSTKQNTSHPSLTLLKHRPARSCRRRSPQTRIRRQQSRAKSEFVPV